MDERSIHLIWMAPEEQVVLHCHPSMQPWERGSLVFFRSVKMKGGHRPSMLWSPFSGSVEVPKGPLSLCPCQDTPRAPLCTQLGGSEDHLWNANGLVMWTLAVAYNQRGKIKWMLPESDVPAESLSAWPDGRDVSHIFAWDLPCFQW